jgi:hypothetical protein
LLVCSLSGFAENGKNISLEINSEKGKAILEIKHDGDHDETCVATCWANIYYEGEYVGSVANSSTSSDCSSAKSYCMSGLRIKIAAFQANYE